jgi:hypothetical protein
MVELNSTFGNLRRDVCHRGIPVSGWKGNLFLIRCVQQLKTTTGLTYWSSVLVTVHAIMLGSIPISTI